MQTQQIDTHDMLLEMVVNHEACLTLKRACFLRTPQEKPFGVKQLRRA